jgi:hypothetical protein
MPKVPRIKDVNHFIKNKELLISGYYKADCTGFRPAAGLNPEPCLWGRSPTCWVVAESEA